MGLWDGSWPAVANSQLQCSMCPFGLIYYGVVISSSHVLGNIGIRLFVPRGVPVDVYLLLFLSRSLDQSEALSSVLPR